MGKRVSFGSLFSGIGGFDLGLERAGMVVKWQVERDPWCQKVLAKHWPAVPRYTNVEDVGSNLECVDLICGGFPCQPVSVSGDQKGTSDDRWLWPEFRRIVGVLRPRYVLLENVPGLFTANGGHAFGEVIGDLADLGYDCEWTVLSAADVGAPHLRKRVWIVADADRLHRGYVHDGTTENIRHLSGGSSSVADADRRRCEESRESQQRAQQGSRRSKPDGRLSDGRVFDAPVGGQWPVEPDVGRVADGVPRRVDRLRGLGNAIVPHCAEWIGRQLVSQLTPESTSQKG